VRPRAGAGACAGRGWSLLRANHDFPFIDSSTFLRELSISDGLADLDGRGSSLAGLLGDFVLLLTGGLGAVLAAALLELRHGVLP
jgi:hypothetical protein